MAVAPALAIRGITTCGAGECNPVSLNLCRYRVSAAVLVVALLVWWSVPPGKDGAIDGADIYDHVDGDDDGQLSPLEALSATSGVLGTALAAVLLISAFAVIRHSRELSSLDHEELVTKTAPDQGQRLQRVKRRAGGPNVAVGQRERRLSACPQCKHTSAANAQAAHGV